MSDIAHFCLLNAFTRRLSRETFRAAALACTIPFCAARMTNGWAARRAAAAGPGSPAAIASSTLRTQVRIWLRRDRLTSARRSILRTAFLAERVFAINNFLVTGQRENSFPWPRQPDFRNGNRLPGYANTVDLRHESKFRIRSRTRPIITNLSTRQRSISAPCSAATLSYNFDAWRRGAIAAPHHAAAMRSRIALTLSIDESIQSARLSDSFSISWRASASK